MREDTFNLYFNDHKVEAVTIDYIPLSRGEGGDTQQLEFDVDADEDYEVEFDELRIITTANSIVQTFLLNDKIARRIVINVQDIDSTDVREIER